jgi:hypothetical protein
MSREDPAATIERKLGPLHRPFVFVSYGVAQERISDRGRRQTQGRARAHCAQQQLELVDERQPVEIPAGMLEHITTHHPRSREEAADLIEEPGPKWLRRTSVEQLACRAGSLVAAEDDADIEPNSYRQSSKPPISHRVVVVEERQPLTGRHGSAGVARRREAHVLVSNNHDPGIAQ